jgi:cobalt-zinc-cadmium efflux system outer membrane protein
MVRRLILLSCFFLVSGCAWPVRQTTDQVVRELVEHPFDIAPQSLSDTAKTPTESRKSETIATSSRSGRKSTVVPDVPTDVLTTAWMEAKPGQSRQKTPLRDDAVQTAAWKEAQQEAGMAIATPRKPDLNIPPQLPGSEAPRLQLPTEKAAAERAIDLLYKELPSLPTEPKVLPGPEGKPYTLSDLQRLAAANSPTLRQAVSDVEAAKGNLIQARTYPNPTLSYLVDPSNNNSTAGVQGAAIEQIIRTGGKMKLGVAQAQRDLDNAVLALKRARSDLSTSVRNAYFTLLVDKETLVVTRALAQFTDDIYRIQTGLLRGAQAAPYEPASLRAQAYMTRLAYKQAIFSYIYDWKSLVATIGLQQLPLSEVAGQVDRLIPYYDYDKVLAHVLRNHTDILTARNTLGRAQLTLKLSQVTPAVPDLDVRMTLEKDFALAPFGTYHTLSVGFPIPIWDQNKGNIIAAQAALVRASEEAHRVEVTLANNLAAAYSNYKNNLVALEEYRRNILPDLVRYYRGIFARRQIDPSSPFGDLVAAQQILQTNVITYIGVLGTLWTSVVGVADFLQTDDLFQLASPRELPELPDFNQLCLLYCGHPALAQSSAKNAEVRGHVDSNYGAGVSPAQPASGPPARQDGRTMVAPSTDGVKGGAPPSSSVGEELPEDKGSRRAPEAPSTTTGPLGPKPNRVLGAMESPDLDPAAPAK